MTEQPVAGPGCLGGKLCDPPQAGRCTLDGLCGMHAAFCHAAGSKPGPSPSQAVWVHPRILALCDPFCLQLGASLDQPSPCGYTPLVSWPRMGRALGPQHIAGQHETRSMGHLSVL